MSVYQFALTIFVSHLCLSLKHTHTHTSFLIQQLVSSVRYLLVKVSNCLRLNATKELIDCLITLRSRRGFFSA